MTGLFVSLKILCFYSCFYRIACIGSSHDSLTTQHPIAPVQDNIIDVFNVFTPLLSTDELATGWASLLPHLCIHVATTACCSSAVYSVHDHPHACRLLSSLLCCSSLASSRIPVRVYNALLRWISGCSPYVQASAASKAAHIHDVIADLQLDVLAVTETWITSDAPDAINLDVAPPGYHVIHRPRGTSTDKRGGGIAFLCREDIKVRSFDVGSPSELKFYF